MRSMMRLFTLGTAIFSIGTILAANTPASATPDAAGIKLLDGLFGKSGGDVVALAGERTLLFIDLKQNRVVRQVAVKNIGSRVVGIDVRPKTKELWALLASGHLVVIDRATGQATPRSKLSVALPPGKVSIDFNPSVDRLRIVSSNGTNLRTNVDDGATLVDMKITYAMPNPFGGTMPAPVAVAYTNSRPGTVPATTLRAIDDPTDALYQVQPANDGVMVPIGALHAPVGSTIGFDIATDSTGRNIGLVVAGRSIAQIDLAGGAVIDTAVVKGVTGHLRDVAAFIQ